MADDTQSDKGQYSERFVAAVGQVASNELAIRLGGLASLDALSGETADEYKRVWNYLGDFLRYPPALQGWRSEEEDETDSGEIPIGQHPDIAAIAGMIRNRSEKQKEWGKKFPLPLHQAKLHGANLQDANLQGANLQDANLQDAVLQDANLHGANLRGADLCDANLQGANLEGADLQGADLQDANLEGADLHGAKLHGADLEGADLKDANLRHADLHGANLEGADLKDANLHGANLQHAYLQDTNLHGVQLIGALFGPYSNQEQDLRGKINLTPNRLQGTWYEQGGSAPILPDSWPEDCKPRPIEKGEWLNKRIYEKAS